MLRMYSRSFTSLLPLQYCETDFKLISSFRSDLAPQDIYTSPVSIKSCHHTFCSACIRTHINQPGNSGSFCPKCRQTKAYDAELVPQPVLEITALEWKKARAYLARLQTEHDDAKRRQDIPQAGESSTSALASNKRPQSEQNGDPGSEVFSAGASPRRSKRVRTEILKPVGSRSSPLTIDDDDDEDDLINATDDEMEAGPSALRSVRGQVTNDDDDGDYIDGAASSRSSPSKRRNPPNNEATGSDAKPELKADDLVSCPICDHKFTVTALNRHLDSAGCHPGFPEPTLEERGLASKPKKTTSSWFTNNAASSSSTDGAASMANEKRIHRLQYTLKSDRDLRKLLEDAGLPTTGDREKLTERHRQWVNIWNANLDSTKARRSAAQLKKDLAAWERTRTSAKDHSAHVDKQKTTWVKSNKSQFDDLIQKAKMGALKDKSFAMHLQQLPSRRTMRPRRQPSLPSME